VKAKLLLYPSEEEIFHDLTFQEARTVAIRSANLTGRSYIIREEGRFGTSDTMVSPEIATQVLSVEAMAGATKAS